MRIKTQPLSLFRVSIASLSFGLALFAFGVTPHADAAPDAGERLITIHDRGVDRGIITKTDNLRDAMDEAGIVLDKNDMVEPGLDEKLVTNNYQVNIYRARPIIIVDGHVKQLVMSAYQTPKQIAEHAGVTLQDEDTAEIRLTNDMVTDGASERMTIDRAAPIKLTLYGKVATVYSQAETVAEFLKEKSIELGKKDTLSVKSSAPIRDNMKIEIWRNGKQTVTKEELIEFPTKQIQDTDRDVGYKKIQTPGVKGKKTVTYEITMKNGKQVQRKVVQSVVTKKPAAQVEIVGAKLTNTFSGSFGEALARLRSCEGSYTSNTGNGYYGAYQYDIGTWGGYKGYANAAEAPPKVQDEKVWITYQARGWNPWPSCKISQGLQDIYR